MLAIQNKQIFSKLLVTTSSDEIASLIEKEDFFGPENCLWKPYGGQELNARQVEGQMKSSSNALVEKITNSIDALLMKRCYETEGVPPESDNPKLPKTLLEAIAKYFGSEEEINKKRSEWSKQHLVVLAEGDKKKPTITIVDRGEGQLPNRIQDTIVGLSESIKEKINFVFGKYHQGGSAAIRFCGSKAKCYQLVLARRAETIAGKGKEDAWGFTLVRRNYKNRIAYYEYCTEKDGSTFSFPYDKPIKINGAEIDFIDGCLIRLYDYYLENPSNITYGRSSLALDIDQKLQKAPLPIFLHELRSGYRGDTKYTIAGLLRRIEDNKDIINDDITLPAGLGEIGTRNIRCIRLKHISEAKGVESYKQQREKIFYIENGLALGYETESFLRSNCQLPALAPYLLCYIDMSDIRVDLANIFHAGREELARTEDYQFLKERLKKFFENEIFEKWDKEYEEKSFTSAVEDNKELDKLIEKAIVDDPELKDLLGIGEEIKIPKGKEEEKEEYKGEDYPKKFEFIGGQPKEVDKTSYAIASFRTEANDNLLTRKKERFLIEWTPSKLFDVVLRGMNKGIISLRIDCRENIKADDEDKITFVLADQDRTRKFEQTVHFKAIETPPYEGFYFPTYFEPQKDILKIPPKVSRKFTFVTDVANDYFTRDKDVGSMEFEERSDLQTKRFRLNDGILEITFYTPIDKLGKRADIKLAIADAAGHRFDFVIPFEIVPLEESSKLNEPKRKLVRESDWPSRSGPDGQWNEHDIAGVDSSRTQGGLIVYLNVDSKSLRELKKIVGVDKVESAQNKYLADVYIYSLYLYFEFKNDPDKDRILSTSMRAVGKALPGMIRKII